MKSPQRRLPATLRLIVYLAGAILAVTVIFHFYPAWSAAGFPIVGHFLFSNRDGGSAVAIAMSLIVLAYSFAEIAYAIMDLSKGRWP